MNTKLIHALTKPIVSKSCQNVLFEFVVMHTMWASAAVSRFTRRAIQGFAVLSIVSGVLVRGAVQYAEDQSIMIGIQLLSVQLLIFLFFSRVS